VLANAPELVAATREAEEDLRAGRARPLDEVMAELDDDLLRGARRPSAAVDDESPRG
jgi:hypothetical protein